MGFKHHLLVAKNELALAYNFFAATKDSSLFGIPVIFKKILIANVLACQYGFCDNVLACQCAKSVPTSHYVPTCQYTCQRANTRANVPYGVRVFQVGVPTY